MKFVVGVFIACLLMIALTIYRVVLPVVGSLGSADGSYGRDWKRLYRCLNDRIYCKNYEWFEDWE